MSVMNNSFPLTESGSLQNEPSQINFIKKMSLLNNSFSLTESGSLQNEPSQINMIKKVTGLNTSFPVSESGSLQNEPSQINLIKKMSVLNNSFPLAEPESLQNEPSQINLIKRMSILNSSFSLTESGSLQSEPSQFNLIQRMSLLNSSFHLIESGSLQSETSQFHLTQRMSILNSSFPLIESGSLYDELSQTCTVIEDDLTGKTFSSWEEFCNFFDNWCEKTKTVYNKRNTSPPASQDLEETFKFKWVFLLCRHYRSAGKYVKPRKGYWRPGCPSRIVLKLDPERGKLIITRAILIHNHKLCPVEFTKWFRASSLTGKTRFLIRITNKLARQFLEMRDVKTLLKYCKSPYEDICELLEGMERLMSADPGAKVKLVFVENHIIVKYLIIVTSHMMSLCEKFPFVLYFSKMSHLNSEFDLCTLLCRDANGRIRECAYCITRKGTPNLLRLMVVSLVQSVPLIKVHVHCLIVGSITEDLDGVSNILPKAKVQFCRSEVIKTLYNKATELQPFLQNNIWDFLCMLANSLSSTFYNVCLQEMKVIFCMEFLQYFQDVWHSQKEMWVKCWSSEQEQGIAFSSIVRFQQQMFASELSTSSTLADYVRVFLKLQTVKVETADLDEVKICAHYRETCPSNVADLIKEEISLAKYGCYRIQDDGLRFVLNDGVSDYAVNKKQTSCSCTIHISTFLPCRHIFATRLWTGETLFFFKLHKF
ncbi:uncharacterized protein ZSWIM9-like isoform X2 [Protopterus annectens]|nr:uncharacterized protein ZSWIM9-like isoform X2 [Protopterus annectens]